MYAEYEYKERAKRLLREAMAAQSVTIDELTRRLAAIGGEMSSGAVANKTIREGFSAAFLLQCVEAFDLELRAFEP